MSIIRAAALLIGCTAAAAQACDPALAGVSVARSESARYVLEFRTQPSPISVGEHFGLEVALCAKPGAPIPEELRVDAHMPAHRHGMNYLPALAPAGPNRWRAEGLLFHMPGDWEFRFDVHAGGTTDRLAYPYRVE